MAVAAPLLIGAQIAGGVVGAAGSLMEGEAQRKAALYQAATARNMAGYATIQGQEDASRQLLKTGQMVGQQRVAAAANGVDVGSGSAMDIQTSTQEMGAADAQLIRENARAKAGSYLDQAKLYEMEAKNARRKGYLDAFSSIIGGATSAGSSWASFKSMGVM